MKYLLPILVVMLSACASPKVKEDVIAKATADSVSQHIAVAVTLAKFYCVNNSWPSSIESLQQFSTETDLPLPVKIDWPKLKESGVTYEITSNAYLRTPDESQAGGGHSVSSVNEPPECNGKDFNVNVHPTIGG